MGVMKKIITAAILFSGIFQLWGNSYCTEENYPDYGDMIIDAVTTTIDLFTKDAFKKQRLPKGTNYILIKTNVRNAQVYINNESKGMAPVKINNLTPGNYKLTVEKEGYRPINHYLRINDATGYEYNFTMENIMGHLELNDLPAESFVYIDGERISKTFIDIPEGPHNLKVRCFGYYDLNTTITIQKHYLKKIKVFMQECDFDLTGFKVSKERFNPNYKSSMGRTTFTVEVTANGSGTLEIKDFHGNTVFSREIPSFYTWQTQIDFNGRDSSNYPLPDGFYTALFTAGEKILHTTFQIDRTLFYHLTDLTYAGTGFGTIPQAITMPQRTILFDFSLSPVWKTNTGFYDMPITFGLSCWFTDNVELSGKFAAFSKLDSDTSKENSCPILASGSLKYTGKIKAPNSQFTYAGAIHYGYCSQKKLETPYGSDCGVGLGLTGMFGFETEKFFTGLSTDFIMGATSSKPSEGDNTWRNGISLSLTPVPEMAINLSCALNSNSNPFDSIEPSIGFSTFIPGLPLMFKISGQAKIHFDQNSYFSGTAGFSYLF